MKPYDWSTAIGNPKGTFWLSNGKVTVVVARHYMRQSDMDLRELVELPFDIFLKRLKDFHISPENLILRMSDFQ